MNWAAWGPTVVSAITCIFFAGVVYQRQTAHAERLKDHGLQLEDHTRDLTRNSVDIAMLKAWRDGYAAARQAYEVKPAHGTD